MVQPTFAASSKRMVFLYAGVAKTDGTKYPSYINPNTKVNWISWLSSGSNEFVISCTDKWQVYHRDNIPGRRYSDLAASISNCINEVLQVKPNAKIWVSLPPVRTDIAPTSDYTEIYYAKYKTYLLTLKSKIGSYKWSRNVVGVYFTTEAINGDIIKPDRAVSCNKMVRLMNDISYYIHTYHYKKFLWCPHVNDVNNSYYYLKKIATVANRTNIFDYILLQLGYYFKPDYTDNLDIVYNSVINQKVLGKNNQIIEFYGVKLNKLSHVKTQIGVQMEIDRSYISDYYKAARYDNSGNPFSHYAPNNYVKRFNSIKTSYPFSFYCGDASGLNTVYYKINNFYNW